MKRLALFFDGTWETRPSFRSPSRTSPTNVEIAQTAVLREDSKGNAQVTMYFPGIGTDKGFGLWAGMTGKGISATICQAYSFIVDNFTIGKDQLYLFGFSRGAYTARSLSGFMQWVGVLKKAEHWRIRESYEQYKLPLSQRKQEYRGEPLQIIGTGQTIPIRFLGVWDTVGSLGVPAPILRKFINAPFVGFHNTELAENVSYACHALAIHELRKDFPPTLWTKSNPGQTVEQVWFSGTHCDVGGGNAKHGLSDIALLWMLCRAADRHLELELDTAYLARRAKPDYRADIYDSSAGRWMLSPRRLRTYGKALNETRHPSVEARLAYIAANAQKSHRKQWRKAEKNCQTDVSPGTDCHHPTVPNAYIKPLSKPTAVQTESASATKRNLKRLKDRLLGKKKLSPKAKS